MQMTLKLTALAGAVALALGAGQASASIIPSDIGTGDSEMVLSVWDTARNTGYTLDLGFFQSTLTPAGVGSQTGTISNSGSLLMSFAPDTLLTTFLADSAANGSLGNVLWNVVGGDGTGLTANTRKLLTTAQSSVAETTIEALSSAQMNNILSTFNGYVSQVNSGTTGTHQTQENGSNIEVLGDGLGNDFAYAGGAGWGTAFGGNGNFNNAAGLGQGLNFWSLSNGASAFAKVAATQFFGASAPAIWTLANDGTLTFAAVPEAETWALLGLGLIGVGALARRRGRALQAA